MYAASISWHILSFVLSYAIFVYMKRTFYFLLIVAAAFQSCKKDETITISSISEIYPLKAGKIFIYRLDSTLVGTGAQQLILRSYNAKDSIDSEFLDAQGRTSFRIFRYLRDTFDLQPWKYTATYYATFTDNRVEYNDNNFRFVTLVNPVKEGVQWQGTQYINTAVPYDYLANWTFEYQNVGEPFVTKKGTIQDTYTVFQQDELSPDGPFNPANFQARSYSKEVYGKGIGLIYKEFLHWEYQPATFYSTLSYGIKLNLKDYK